LAKSDEGELEFILGNKQLILVFMTVVVLLAVAFSMGYILGRNSTTPVEAAHTKSVPIDSPPPDAAQASSTPPSSAPEPSTNPSQTITPPTGPETTHPEQPAPSKPAPEPKKQEVKVEPKQKPAPVGPPAETQTAAAPSSQGRQPAPGLYWQVAATSRPGAEIISEVLARRGFHALVAPASRQGYFRVLVGPYEDAAAQAEARTKLEAVGFKNPINHKY